MRTLPPPVSLTALAFAGVLLAAPGRAQDSAKTSYAVMPLSLARGIDEKATQLLDEMLLTELQKRGGDRARFLGQSDITAMLGLEQQRQLVQCSDESCMAEIGNALGVDILVTSSLGKLGNKFVINVKVIKPDEVRVLRRETFTVAGDEAALIEVVPRIANVILDQQQAAPPVADVAAATPPAPAAEPAEPSAPAEEPAAGEGLSMLSLAGIGAAAAGGLVLAGSAVGVALADATLADPASTGKDGARTGYLLGLGGLVVGALAAGGGVVLLLLG